MHSDHRSPRFIYFDLDDTLLDHRSAEQRALADVCADYEAAFGAFELRHVQETYHTHNVGLWQQYAHGAIDKHELQRLRFERLLEALAVELEPDEVGGHYLSCYARHWRFVEGAREAFLDLAARYPVGVLTNGFAETQHAKLDRFPEIRGAIDQLVVSEEIGRMKPHPEIFRHAAEAAGVEPEEILYVGDSFGSDVQGGRAAGWRVAWFGGDPGRVTGDEGVTCFTRWNELTERL